MSLIAARAALTSGMKKSTEPFWGLKITAKEANSTVYFGKFGSPPEISLCYSLDDGLNWNTFQVDDDVITLANVGDGVCFAPPDGVVNTQFNVGARTYRKFRFTGTVSATGSILSLVSKDKATALATPFPIRNLIYLLNHWSSDSFSLIEAQFLLHAKILDGGNQYFTSFFRGQTLLSRIETDITSWDDSDSSNNYATWVAGVAPTGTFICPAALGTQNTIQRDDGHCPPNWQVVNI